MSPPEQAEAQRLATLQASWKRDRQVARRRLLGRWLAWAFWRYGLALLLVLACAVALAAWLAHSSRNSLHEPRFILLPAPGQTAEPESPLKRQEP